MKINLYPIFAESNHIDFTLIIRKKTNNIFYDPENGVENVGYCRIIQVNKEYIRSALLQERKELDDFLKECHSSEEYDLLTGIEEVRLYFLCLVIIFFKRL